MTWKLSLRLNAGKRSLFDQKDRFDLILNGINVGEVYFNMTGYLVSPGLPLPGRTSRLALPEQSLAGIKREISALNREAIGLFASEEAA